jgi:hypothetical protein
MTIFYFTLCVDGVWNHVSRVEFEFVYCPGYVDLYVYRVYTYE